MTIPLRDISLKLVEKFKERFLQTPPKAAGPLPPPAPVDKPDSDKFAKTVVPNAMRTITQESSAPGASSPSTGPRMVAMGRSAMPTAHDLPPAVAVALEPRVERVVSLALEDVIEAMPEGYLKPRESFDMSRRVLVKAAEVERGMAVGRPTISVANIYQQMPEIFMHTVPASDASLVALPFEKVMHQLSSLHLRNDQTPDQVVPQVQTPFLQVTVEDTKRFGLPMEPIVTAEMPPVRVEPATAQSIAAAEPEPTAREKFTPSTMDMASLPMARLRNRAASPEKESAQSGAPGSDGPRGRIPDRIPFKLPTKDKFGTGEPAIPRVPASTSGPPVPPSPGSPMRVPFASAALSESPVKTAASPSDIEAEDTDESTLTVPLLPILRALPPMQLAGELERVSSDAKVSFRAHAILPQLALGKVVIKPEEFHAALPSEYRDLFLPDATATPVQLPLADVLANLPEEALRMRDDQEDSHRQDEIFETPFSAKAQEDAQRFAGRAAPAKSQPSTTSPELAPSVPAKSAEQKASRQKQPAPKALDTVEAESKQRGTLETQNEEAESRPNVPVTEPLKTEMAVPMPPAPPKFDAKEAILQACSLPDVSSCGVIFADGLSLAGNIPGELQIDGLTAVAPTLLQKFHKHMLDTQLGALSCITVHGEKARLSFFAAGDICLTAVQQAAELAESTRHKLAEIAQRLSETYSEPAHVDH